MAEKGKTTRKKRVITLLTEEQRISAEDALAKRREEDPDVYNLPASKRNPQDLLAFFENVNEGTNRILPKEKRRYVIYLRKSTDDESKQVRSLEDQEVECLSLAEAQGITVRPEDILSESASAKTSGQRPIFDDMLQGFRLGKYHGLISWSPDRISRNMKEAGEVIEMIDMELIQDLQFKTYQFENNPNGKMLLGILFATSKQYSDKLGVDVKRGNTGKIRDGKYNGVSKKGYYIDANTGYFMPDGYNWELMREALNMRLYQGYTNTQIAEFLNENNLSVRKDQDDDYAKVKVDKQMVGDLFADSFYFGLYKYGKNLATLTDIYDFLPLMTADEYVAANRDIADSFSESSTNRRAKSNRLDYGLLRNKVICAYCEVPMQFQNQKIKLGKNAGSWLVSFYCRNSKECQRYKTAENAANGIKLQKSIRAKDVMAAIEWTLRTCTKQSEEAYSYYIGSLEERLAQDRAMAKRKLNQAKADLKLNEAQYIKYQNFQVDHPEEYKKHHEGKLEHYTQLINQANHNIAQNQQVLEQLKDGLPTKEQFYELTSSYLETLLNTTDLVEQNEVCNELVSNLWAENGSVSVITLNPPYNLLADLPQISIGRGERTRTSGLLLPKQAR